MAGRGDGAQVVTFLPGQLTLAEPGWASRVSAQGGLLPTPLLPKEKHYEVVQLKVPLHNAPQIERPSKSSGYIFFSNCPVFLKLPFAAPFPIVPPSLSGQQTNFCATFTAGTSCRCVYYLDQLTTGWFYGFTVTQLAHAHQSALSI